MLEERFLSFLEKFNEHPFCVKTVQKEYKIGEGVPEFTVNMKKPPSMTALMTSTSLALREAYMDGDLEIEGDLYSALDSFLRQMNKFSTDESALKNPVMFVLQPRWQKNKSARKSNDFLADLSIGLICRDSNFPGVWRGGHPIVPAHWR